MQHSTSELLWQAKQVKRSYEFWNHEVAGVEFLYEDMGSHQYLFFKGTSSNGGRFPATSFLWDVLTDFRFFPRTDYTYGLGRHPSGFLESSERLLEYIIDPNTPIDSKKPTMMAGHSLGGAVLLIAAPVLSKYGIHVTSTVTFGAPNVGTLVVNPITRISCMQNGADLIPSLPPLYGDTIRGTKIRSSNFNPRNYFKDHRLDSYIEGLTDVKEGKAFYVR